MVDIVIVLNTSRIDRSLLKFNFLVGNTNAAPLSIVKCGFVTSAEDNAVMTRNVSKSFTMIYLCDSNIIADGKYGLLL